MDTARHAQQSDPEKNWNFRRFRPPAFQLRPAPARLPDVAEPAFATVLRWRDEWRARQAARPSRLEAAR